MDSDEYFFLEDIKIDSLYVVGIGGAAGSSVQHTVVEVYMYVMEKEEETTVITDDEETESRRCQNS